MLKFSFKISVPWVTWKILIWNNAIDFFITQNQSLALTFWRWNVWSPHASWYFSAFVWPKVHSLSYQMPTLFSKEHVISGSHPDNFVCGRDPLDQPKSDADCPGHPTLPSRCSWMCPWPAEWWNAYVKMGLFDSVMDCLRCIVTVARWCQLDVMRQSEELIEG